MLRASAVVLLLIGVAIGLAWRFQRHLIYFPDTSPVPAATSTLAGVRDVTLTTTDGLALPMAARATAAA